MKINPLQSQFVGLLCAVALFAGIVSGFAAEADAGTNKPASIASPGSTPKSEAEKAATSAAQAWLALIDNGNYAKSWQEAAAFFQGAVTQKAWENAMESARKPLGKLASREVKTARSVTALPGAPDGQYVVVQFDTSFAGKKSAVETVTFMLGKDGQWRAAGYFIN
jgi:hypothetical protein